MNLAIWYIIWKFYSLILFLLLLGIACLLFIFVAHCYHAQLHILFYSDYTMLSFASLFYSLSILVSKWYSVLSFSSWLFIENLKNMGEIRSSLEVSLKESHKLDIADFLSWVVIEETLDSSLKIYSHMFLIY